MQIKAAVVRERSGPFLIDTVELCDPRPEELTVRVVATGICQINLHGRERLFHFALPCRLRSRRRRRGACGWRRSARLRAGRSRRDVISLVRNPLELQPAQNLLRRALARPENARHPARRVDAFVEGRCSGLQRIFPTVVLRHLCAHAGTFCSQGAQGRSAGHPWSACLQRANRGRSGAQCHETETGRRHRHFRRRRGRAFRLDGGKNRRVRSHRRQ